MIDELAAANQVALQELRHRPGVQIDPQTFTNCMFNALAQILAERVGDPTLPLDVQVRYHELLRQVLNNALAQTTRIEIAGQVPGIQWPGGNGGGRVNG